MSGVPQFPQVLQSQKAAGTLFNTYTTAKSVLNATELQTLPANYLTIGSKLAIEVYGAISNVVTAVPTFTFQLMIGSVVAWSSGAISTNATANTLLPFTLKGNLRVDSVGSGTAAKLIGGLNFTCAAMASGSTSIVVPVTSPAVGTGFDSTIANIVDLWVGISASSASNGVQIYDFDISQKMF
jgi:hypothetical protein